MYQEDQDNINTWLNDPSNDLDNNTILVSGEYEEVNTFVEVEHNKEDDDNEGVEGKAERQRKMQKKTMIMTVMILQMWTMKMSLPV